ncbi:MAG: bifunctional transcriptional activator/DNA repair enzyme AdaA [Pirellulaceae bacterium]
MTTTLEKSPNTLPSFHEMYAAVCASDSQYEGVFIAAVRTTGVFCRPTCPARKPKAENVRFFTDVGAALAAGFRPCKRCRPLEARGETPAWIRDLLARIEHDPAASWTDARLRDHGVQPATLRRWFNQHHGMTFQQYLRSRRMQQASEKIKNGNQVTDAALDVGYQSLSGFRDAFQRWCGEIPVDLRDSSSPLIFNRIVTPLGPMIAVAADAGICLLEFVDRSAFESQVKSMIRHVRRSLVVGEHPLIQQLASELDEYFIGERQTFEVPLIYPGTEFQVAVWNQLREIPYGETCSYDDLARAIGKPGAQRAVGRANGDNRLAIVIPCHRVIRGDGKPGGYGGLVWRKHRLLELESPSRQVSFHWYSR